MVEEIKKYFQEMIDKYAELIVVTSDIWNLFKETNTSNGDIRKIESKIKMQNILLEEKEKIINNFIEVIKKYCRLHNVAEEKLSELMRYFTVEQKEEIVDLQRTTFNLKEKYKNILEFNLIQSKFFKERSEKCVDAWIYFHQKIGKESMVIDQEV